MPVIHRHPLLLVFIYRKDKQQQNIFIVPASNPPLFSEMYTSLTPKTHAVFLKKAMLRLLERTSL